MLIVLTIGFLIIIAAVVVIAIALLTIVERLEITKDELNKMKKVVWRLWNKNEHTN